MATLQKTMQLKLEGIETIERISNAIELQKEMEALLAKMYFDLHESKHVLSPHCKRYGMDKSGLLNVVLETYHQLRLKDD